jgi:hypothetical protein
MGMNSELMIVHYSVLALTIFVCTYLFLTVKRDLRVIETRYLRRGESLRTQLRELTDELETVRREMETMEQKSDPSATVGRTLGSGVRIQALRMIKHGEGPEHIASALSLPRTEVELLVKVQRLLAEQQPQSTS